MKERPILFSTDMVQAILDGRKSVTRRAMKPQPVKKGLFYEWAGAGWTYDRLPIYPTPGHSLSVRCPYGVPGDLLWVRETWSEYYDPNGHPYEPLIAYKADGTAKPAKWRPSIHMHKHNARIWLRVKEIRVERLQDIAEHEAKAEGIKSYPVIDDLIAYKNYDEFARKDFLSDCSYSFNHGKETHPAPVASFCTLWMDINGRESWISNPWVWVISFDIVSTSGRPTLIGHPLPNGVSATGITNSYLLTDSNFAPNA